MMIFDWQDIEGIDSHFTENGWIAVDCPDKQIIQEASDFILKTVQSIVSSEIDRLENYHKIDIPLEKHLEYQYQISKAYWDAGFGPNIMGRQSKFLRNFIGRDINVQKSPYLRIARPNVPEDNLGLHRDIHYGSSAYECSCFTPFIDLDKGNALKVISGSHTATDDDFPVTRVNSETVEKGSKEHQIGFAYAPNVLDKSVEDQATIVPLKIGQMMIFSLSLVHGQSLNISKKHAIFI